MAYQVIAIAPAKTNWDIHHNLTSVRPLIGIDNALPSLIAPTNPPRRPKPLLKNPPVRISCTIFIGFHPPSVSALVPGWRDWYRLAEFAWTPDSVTRYGNPIEQTILTSAWNSRALAPALTPCCWSSASEIVGPV